MCKSASLNPVALRSGNPRVRRRSIHSFWAEGFARHLAGPPIYTASREELATSAADLFAAIRDGVLNVAPSRTYTLDDIVLAHRDLESRQIIGAAVIEPSKA